MWVITSGQGRMMACALVPGGKLVLAGDHLGNVYFFPLN